MPNNNFTDKRNLIFMGTPSFVVPVLQSLSEFDWNIIVYTAPDRPSGRGKKVRQSDVKVAALDLGFLVKQPESFVKNSKSVDEIIKFLPDLIIVAGYGLILPKEILDSPPLGCINIHPSILPKYRGPSPVSTAILNGDSDTGVTLMMMDEGLDSGPILDQKIVSIDQSDRNETLTKKLFLIGSELLKDYLNNLKNNSKTPLVQDDLKATYTSLVLKQDGKLDFSRDAEFLERQLRAYDPWPGIYANFEDTILKILSAKVMQFSNKDLFRKSGLIEGSVILLDGIEEIGYFQSKKFYKISKDSIGVVTRDGSVLELQTVQLPGRKVITGQQFLLNHPKVLSSRLT